MLWKEGSARWGRNFGLTIIIWIAQGLGALAGFGIALLAFDFKKKPGVNDIPAGPSDYYIAQLCPRDGCNDEGAIMAKVFCMEMVMTFLFVTFVLVIVKHNGAQDMPINAAAIGLALYLCVREASGVSGGCINPAVGLVQSVMQRSTNAHVYPDAKNVGTTYVVAYVGATLLGGFLAGIFQKIIYEFAFKAAHESAQREYVQESE